MYLRVEIFIKMPIAWQCFEGKTECFYEPLPVVLVNTGAETFLFTEQGILSNSSIFNSANVFGIEGTSGSVNGELKIKSKNIKGSWEHVPPPPLGGAFLCDRSALIAKGRRAPCHGRQ